MKPAVASRAYPVFHDPEEYLLFRRDAGVKALLKAWAERRALNSCFAHTGNVRTICDCPCGPGRLFPYWKNLGVEVFGIDYSHEMVEAAAALHRRIGLAGGVRRGDAFRLSGEIPPGIDVVCSVRFVYYFDEEDRRRLLHSFLQVRPRYLLLQYKTFDTFRGRRNFLREMRKAAPGKYYLSLAQIADDVKASGLRLLHMAPIGFASDRVFVLCAPDGA